MLDLSDRSHCFYWQTDRILDVNDFDRYFLQRHALSSEEITELLRKNIKTLGKIQSIEVIEPNEEVKKGNVNVVRKVIINGQEYVARIHPRGIKNGYFYVEALALKKAHDYGVPVPLVLEVHEAANETDMDFALMTSVAGHTLQTEVAHKPDSEAHLLKEVGRLMAKIHQIKVDGFGSFDNQRARDEGKLVGLHKSYQDFIFCGLEENIQRLLSFDVINQNMANTFRSLFDKYVFSPLDGSRLIHNDYADWNILVNDSHVSAVLDWDECHAGDPIADLACWSTFFDIERMKHFLEGYQESASLPEDYDLRFHYYRLRYTISKMALRVKRAQVDHSPEVKKRIEVGKKALEGETAWFQL